MHFEYFFRNIMSEAFRLGNMLSFRYILYGPGFGEKKQIDLRKPIESIIEQTRVN